MYDMQGFVNCEI